MITLRLMTGESYIDVLWSYGVARSTEYEIFHETIEIMKDVLPKICFRITENEFR